MGLMNPIGPISFVSLIHAAPGDFSRKGPLAIGVYRAPAECSSLFIKTISVTTNGDAGT
jgi:hypothetical protein